MATSALEQRLVRQMAAKGATHAKSSARAALISRGHVRADGTLTAAGAKRQAMGADGRAKDRAARRDGRPATDYVYNARTNRATLKK